MFSKSQSLVRDGVLIFWGILEAVPSNSERKTKIYHIRFGYKLGLGRLNQVRLGEIKLG